ncbi:MAG: class I SAM-dependent methyltransferase [Candidatus Binatia bacterium]
MKLKPIERVLMNNPRRAGVQRYYEAAVLERIGGRLRGARVLEIGCGRGIGTEIIFERFGAASVCAFDLDPYMAARARHHLRDYPPERLQLLVANALAMPTPPDTFDAVFDFAILHRIPNWRDAVAEIRRVLRPGGRFFFEEITRHERWTYRKLFDHPREERFSAEELVAELERHGLAVGRGYVQRFFRDVVIGVARRE